MCYARPWPVKFVLKIEVADGIGAIMAHDEVTLCSCEQFSVGLSFQFGVYGSFTRSDSATLTPIIAMLLGIMSLNAMVMLVAHRIAQSMYLVPTLAVVSSVLAVLQAALGIQMVLTGLRMAGVI